MLNSGGTLDSIELPRFRSNSEGRGSLVVFAGQVGTCRVDAYEVKFSYSDDGLSSL